MVAITCIILKSVWEDSNSKNSVTAMWEKAADAFSCFTYNYVWSCNFHFHWRKTVWGFFAEMADFMGNIKFPKLITLMSCINQTGCKNAWNVSEPAEEINMLFSFLTTIFSLLSSNTNIHHSGINKLKEKLWY